MQLLSFQAGGYAVISQVSKQVAMQLLCIPVLWGGI